MQLGFKSKLDPEEGTDLFMACIFAFLFLHLPLTGPQRDRFQDRAPAAWRGACADPFVKLLKDHPPTCTTIDDSAMRDLDDPGAGNGAESSGRPEGAAAKVAQTGVAAGPGVMSDDDVQQERGGNGGACDLSATAASRGGNSGETSGGTGGVLGAAQESLRSRRATGAAAEDVVANGNVDGLERPLWLRRIVRGEDAAFRHIVGRHLYQLNVFL